MERPIMARSIIASSISAAALFGALVVQAQEGLRNPERDARIQAAREQLRQLVATDGAEGRIYERVRGSYAFGPARADLPDAPLLNPSAIGALAIGPTLVV